MCPQFWYLANKIFKSFITAKQQYLWVVCGDSSEGTSRKYMVPYYYNFFNCFLSNMQVMEGLLSILDDFNKR